MAGEEGFDINTLRHIHESSTEWDLRKQFLEIHFDKFDMNRLVCLSNCFINVELYGCSYPGPLMVELKSLMEEVDGLDSYRQGVVERNQVKFVKASDDTGADNQWNKNKGIKGISFVKATGKFDSDTKPVPSKPPDPTNILNSPEACTSANTSKTPSQETVAEKKVNILVSKSGKSEEQNEMDSKFYQLGSQLRDILQHTRSNQDANQLVNMAIQKCKMNMNTPFKGSAGDFCCEIFIDGVFVASNNGSNKKMAKRSAFELAFASLKKPYMKVIVLSPDRQELHTSDFPMSGEQMQSFTPTSPVHKNLQKQGITKLGSATKDNIHSLARGVTKKRPHANKLSKSLESFILVEPLHLRHSVNAVTIFNQSSSFNKVPVTYDFREVTDGIQTLLSIGGEVVASSNEPGKAGKLAAAQSLLDELRQSNWTLLVKKRADSDTDLGISKEEVLGEDKANTAIPDSNVGNKLLKMMGWTGGGVGKEGRKGIAEPVTVEAAINRSGLGLSSSQGISREFKPKVKQILEDYIKSSNQDDIAFSPEFLKEERAIIHQLCRIMGLKTRSYDKANERFLVVSRKRNSAQLLQHLVSEGGQTSKYRLVPPGEYDNVRAQLSQENEEET